MLLNINSLLQQFEGFIFDLDGVLIDTEPYHFETWQQLAQENKLQYNIEIADKMRGKTRNQSLSHLLTYNSVQMDNVCFERLLLYKNELYLKRINALSNHHLLRGTYPLLAILKEHNKKIGLASSSRNAYYLVEKTGILPFFHAIVDGNDIQHSKPHPEIFLTCAEKLKLSADKCVVFEDSIAGIQAAQEANMFCVKIGKEEEITCLGDLII